MLPHIRSIDAEQTLPLRQRLLRPGQPLKECVFEGDQAARHFGAFAGDRLVSVASLYSESETRFGEFSERIQVRLRGMATAPEFQGQGFGRALLLRTLDDTFAAGAELYWCNARENAVTFYEHAGFLSLAHAFDLPGIGPHRVMYKRSPKSTP